MFPILMYREKEFVSAKDADEKLAYEKKGFKYRFDKVEEKPSRKTKKVVDNGNRA